MRRACRERGVAAPAPELWACALRSGGERAPLRFYFPVADHVENNNSLGPGQRQLVLLGVPSAAAASSARGFRARVHPQQCALARVRARFAAQRQPAPRRSSAEGHRGVYPRLHGRGGRGAPGLETIITGPGRDPKAQSFAGGSQGCSSGTRVRSGPRGPQAYLQEGL